MRPPQPILVDGVRFRSKDAAALELGCSSSHVNYLLSHGTAWKGRTVALAGPDDWKPSSTPYVAREERQPLLKPEHVTHRLGTYPGGLA
jgi:hypothetical protein